MSESSQPTDVVNSIWKNNPVFVQLLGLTPILAVSTSVVIGLALALITSIVFFISALIISSVRPFINESWRFLTYLVVLACITTLAELVLQIVWFQLYLDLGIYLPLICCNAILLIQLERQQELHSPVTVLTSSASVMGGFLLSMVLISSIRELLGNGSLFNNWQLLIPANTSLVLNESGGDLLDFVLLQPGALLIMGLLLAAKNYLTENLFEAEIPVQPQPAKRARVTGKL